MGSRERRNGSGSLNGEHVDPGNGEKSRDRAACVISDDSQLVEDLWQALSHQVGCDVVASSVSAWIEARRPFGRPQWVFLDLRGGEMWEHLLAMRRSWNAIRGHSPPFIGIVDRGYPVEHLVTADQTLARGLVWPAPGEDMRGLLNSAARAHRIDQQYETGGFHALDGAGFSFRSYTPVLFPVIDEISVAARHDYNLLLVGETGTGKTTLAELIHELSPRSKKCLLTVSCGAMPAELMGSELFGHVKGAFTGADRNKVGKFEVANGGTIVLEEIDTLDLVQQAKLLRVIESGKFEPVGSNDTRKVDTRAIVTANVDLEGLVAAGKFRADLYFRLKQLKFDIPALRKRPRDIAWLATKMVEDCCQRTNLAVEWVHPEFLELLKAHPWPGNIRDLRNEIHRAVLFCDGRGLTPECLSPMAQRDAAKARDQAKQGPAKPGLAEDVAQTEVEAIERMLRATDFNRSATARALGISRVTLYNKMRKYNIRLGDESQP